jgi:hypothetical protein
VLFGGYDTSFLGDTWTWDGTTWTQDFPATSPSAREGMGMTYDQSRGEVVLFGGYDGSGELGDTWTWDGTTWTQHFPATSPSARDGMGLAYDQARGEVVLFDGIWIGDTWTWDGTTWTKQFPATSPPARSLLSMAYDQARGEVVMLGGYGSSGPLGDTWTWDGTTWSVPGTTISLQPDSGPAGTVIQITGSGFAPNEVVRGAWSGFGMVVASKIRADANGAFSGRFGIPPSAPPGTYVLHCTGKTSGLQAEASFVVT